ncbi:DNA/RNA non-specific endonuclease [Cryptosporangium aurantiacum]|uniref:Endonuclease G n=1 Tax=Cryptosporangium aurantiacum TaxID=134849 RepID=A0A1M7R1Y7_9ACTN|nr:DNA/RNA non-specific endonuclease [Cryptosporangium aurantiacum]SHN38814.1 endonuclease G [Cryptosporangium aurantiacum]
MTRSSTDATLTAGYDPGFLGLTVPFPTLPGTATIRLDYTHFSVLMHPLRRLAATTAVAVDGARLVDLPRGDDWQLDPRIPADAQTGNELYRDNRLDRGHLVRRRDPVWGPRHVAATANADTFRFPNAAPQVDEFNQSHELWLGLEDYVLDHAEVHDRNLVVVTGPVLDPSDLPYRGVQIPRRFYKVVAFVHRGALAATGYLLDQSSLLDGLGVAGLEDTDVPPLGAYRTFQVPVAQVAELTGLDLGPLPAADRLTAAAVSPAPTDAALTDSWIELHRYRDIAGLEPR